LKKILFSLALLFSVTSQAEIMLRTSPILLVAGGTNAEIDFKVSENLSVGVGGLSWSAELLDVEFTVTEAHARFDYWFSGAFKQGWYANAGYSTMSMDLKTKDIFGTEFEGEVSGSGVILGMGYHWQWESFHMELGYQLANYSFDSKLELEASDGSTEEESIPSGTSGGLEFNLGWVF
jgi:hypothetical protein